MHDTAQDHNHQLRHILDSATDAYVALDGDAIIVDCNAAAERLFGWSRDEMLGAVATELIPHTLNYESPAAPASVSGGSPRLIGTIWRRDGTDLQVEVVLWQTQDDGRSLWHCLCRDISGRIARLHELALHADRLDEAQRMAALGSWEWDLESGNTRWSSQLYTIVGLDPRRPVSMNALLSRLHASDQSRMTQVLEARLRNGGMDVLEVRLDRRDGTQWWLECRVEAWLDDNGVAVRAAGTVQDISDRKTTDPQRDIEQPLLAAAFDHSTIGCFLYRPGSGIFRVNDAMGRILGVAPEQLMGADPRGFPYVEGANIASITEMVQGRRSTMAVDAAIVRADGSVVWVVAHGVTVPAIGDEPAYVLAQWCDVTAQRPQGAVEEDFDFIA